MRSKTTTGLLSLTLLAHTNGSLDALVNTLISSAVGKSVHGARKPSPLHHTSKNGMTASVRLRGRSSVRTHSLLDYRIVPTLDRRQTGCSRQGRRVVASQAKRGKRNEKKVTTASSPKGFGRQPTTTPRIDRRPTDSSADCACDSGRSYADCCKAVHEGDRPASSPVDLLRSRYTAYCYRMPDYIMATTDPEGDAHEKDAIGWKRSVLKFCDECKFQGLKIGEMLEPTEDGLAQLDFEAELCWRASSKLATLCERSTFRKDDSGRWLFTSGKSVQKEKR